MSETENTKTSDHIHKHIKKHIGLFEGKIFSMVEGIEHSAIGQHFPMSFEKILFSNIVQAVVMISIFYTGSIFSILQGKSYTSGVGSWLWTAMEFIFLVVGVFGSLMDLFIYYTASSTLNILSAIFKIVKGVLLIIFMGSIMIKGFLASIITVPVILFMMVLDFSVFYYMTIFFKRIQSGEYDAYGDLIVENKPVQNETDEPKNVKTDENASDADKEAEKKESV